MLSFLAKINTFAILSWPCAGCDALVLLLEQCALQDGFAASGVT